MEGTFTSNFFTEEVCAHIIIRVDDAYDWRGEGSSCASVRLLNGCLELEITMPIRLHHGQNANALKQSPRRLAQGRSRDKVQFVSSAPLLSPQCIFRKPSHEVPPFPLSSENGIYFYRARIAIYHLFRALKYQAQDLVLVPDYHSGCEVGAIRAAGAGVRFYPIRKNLEPDLDKLRWLCKTVRPRALLTIHYLGWPQPVAELKRLCDEYGMLLIEDCALSLFSETFNQPVGTFGDYSVFCLYKALPIPNGGVLVQNGSPLEGLANLEFDSCSLRAIAGRTLDLSMDWLRSRSNGVGAALSFAKTIGGRYLSSLGVKPVPIGDVGFELSHLNLGMSAMSGRLLRRLDYSSIRKNRRRNYQFLEDQFSGHVTLLDKELNEGACPLYFPILVEDKGSVARALRKRGIAAVEFWNYGDPSSAEHENPDTRFLRRHLLELPVHQDIEPHQLEYMAGEVRKVASK